jgi:hypothetical protein
MLSSKNETVFFERYAGVRLILIIASFFSTPESADSENFHVVKSFFFLLYEC